MSTFLSGVLAAFIGLVLINRSACCFFCKAFLLRYTFCMYIASESLESNDEVEDCNRVGSLSLRSLGFCSNSLLLSRTGARA